MCNAQANYKILIYIYIYIYIFHFIGQVWFPYDRKLKKKKETQFLPVVSIPLYGCTTWTLTKWLEKTLDGNYTRMLRAILNKSWRQHPTRHQLYGHLPPITKTIQARLTRHAGHCWRNRDELISDILLWTPHIWPSKSGTTSSQIHTGAMCGYGMWLWRPARGDLISDILQRDLFTWTTKGGSTSSNLHTAALCRYGM